MEGSVITAYCDNAVVVSVLNTWYIKEEHLMQMLRVLFFTEAKFQFELKASHIPRKNNYQLSRNQSFITPRC